MMGQERVLDGVEKKTWRRTNMRVCISADPFAALSLRQLRRESEILSWVQPELCVVEIAHFSIWLGAYDTRHEVL